MTGNPDVISSSVGLVPRNALVVTGGIAHYKPTCRYRSAHPDIQTLLPVCRRIREPYRPATSGARWITATTCKACASSPGGQEQRNVGPIGLPYGSIIPPWHPCGPMASKEDLEMYRTFAL